MAGHTQLNPRIVAAVPTPTLESHRRSVLEGGASIEAATQQALEAARAPSCDKAFIRLFERSALAAAHDSLAVARVRTAGGVLVGHTNMSEFAFSGVGINPHFGTPLNVAAA